VCVLIKCLSKKNPMRWRVDSELFKNKDLAVDERSLYILFGQ
jgi:hypothetical protein